MNEDKSYWCTLEELVGAKHFNLLFDLTVECFYTKLHYELKLVLSFLTNPLIQPRRSSFDKFHCSVCDVFRETCT